MRMSNIFISCGKRKAESGKRKAESMYQGCYFLKTLAFAKQYFPVDKIFILSAKYGILRLNDIIEPYNVTLNRASKIYKDNWARMVVNQSKRRKISLDDSFYLVGKNYYEPLMPYIKHSRRLFSSLSMGYVMSAIDKLLKK